MIATPLCLLLAERGSSQQPPQRGARAPAREPQVSVTDFGAGGQDDRWDSDAIQRAIDSLPKPSMPGDKAPAGGVVVLPAGRYLLNKPLRIFNGVTLRGEGAGTVLHMTGNDPAILLVCPFDHGYIASAVVGDLSIYTDKSPGIVADKSVTNIVQCRFENLIISSAGCAIDLDPDLAHKIYTQNTLIRNVHVSKFGGPALRLFGNANHVEQLNTEGGTRPGFTADPAIVTIAGELNDIRSCIIEANKPNPAVAVQISGSFTWSHNWIEIDPIRANVAYIFKDVQMGQIDYLHHILPWCKARFINCDSIQIHALNLNGELSSLSQNIELDEKSSVRIDHVIARTDAGMLDDPRVSIGSVFNMTGKYRVDFPLVGSATRLMPAEGARGTGGWHAQWETPLGRIRGSMRLEDDPGGIGQRLKLEITDNPKKRPLGVEVPLPATEELRGRKCVVAWRIDGPGQTIVNQNDRQFPSRAMNSLTANPMPAPLRNGDKLIFVFPPEPGVYYLSRVAIYSPS